MHNHSTQDTRRFTVGVLGGGQLARMMAEAAIRLDVQLRVYQTSTEGPLRVLPGVHTGSGHDIESIDAFLDGCDVVTLDNEWVDLSTILKRLPSEVPLRPGESTMAFVRNKIRQKARLEEMGLPVGPYRACRDEASLAEVAREFGFPVMIKRPTHSYDGYGNRVVNDEHELRTAFADMASDGEVLVEKWVAFAQELAVIVARRPGGETAVYPVATTHQRDNKCESVVLPAENLSPELTEAASDLAVRTAHAFDCVGVVGVELFLLEDGSLLVNEIAPRPHNTGHYTIDACLTSQFENHLRAVLDLPLGETSLLQPAAVMVNVLGTRKGNTDSTTLHHALAVPSTSVHLYGKDEVRPGRKMGHVTSVGISVEQARARAFEAAGKLEL